MKLDRWIGAALLSTLPSLVSAAGLAAHEQSTSALGSALAGNAALSTDASGQWYNPALMEQLPSTMVSLNSQVSYLESRFSDGSGNGGDDENAASTLSSFYFADPVTDRLSIGLGINQPFHVERHYLEPWAGESYALETRIDSLNINPSLAWRLDSKMVLAVGFSYQKLDMKLRNSVYELDVDDVGMGWNAGLLYEPAPGHRLGLAWRSKVNYNLHGNMRWVSNGQVIPVTAGLDTPGTVTGSYAGDLTERTTLLLSVSMTEWQQLQDFVIEEQGGNNSLTEELEWDNSVMSSVGVRYATANGTLLRLGYAHETGSQRETEEVAPLAPDARREWLAVGATFQVAPDFTLDIAVARLFFDQAVIDRSEERDGNPGAEVVRGTYDMNRTMIGGQLNYRF